MAKASSLLQEFLRLSRRGLQELARALEVPTAPDRTSDSLRSGIPAAPGPTSRFTDRIPSEPPADADAAVAGTTWVMFLPRDPQWAYVHWQTAPEAVQLAGAARATELCLRVVNVSGLAGDGASPRVLQEVVVENHATQWYLPVPLSDRELRVELGYRIASTGGWTSLALSAAALMPPRHPS